MTRRPDLEVWLERYDNPMKDVVVSVMSHIGARIPGSYPRLAGSGDTSRG